MTDRVVAKIAAVSDTRDTGIDDKVAATYDHAVVTRAVARHQLMVFGEIAGAVDMKVATSRIARAAPEVPGIDRRSVRTSLAPAAFSFALDPIDVDTAARGGAA